MRIAIPMQSASAVLAAIASGRNGYTPTLALWIQSFFIASNACWDNRFRPERQAPVQGRIHSFPGVRISTSNEPRCPSVGASRSCHDGSPEFERTMVITPIPMSQLAGSPCAHLLHDCIGLLCLAAVVEAIREARCSLRQNVASPGNGTAACSAAGHDDSLQMHGCPDAMFRMAASCRARYRSGPSVRLGAGCWVQTAPAARLVALDRGCCARSRRAH